MFKYLPIKAKRSITLKCLISKAQPVCSAPSVFARAGRPHDCQQDVSATFCGRPARAQASESARVLELELVLGILLSEYLKLVHRKTALASVLICKYNPRTQVLQ